MALLLLIFSALLAIVSAAFALQNTAPVTVSFLAYKFNGPLAVVLMITFALGLATAALALLPSLLNAKWRSLSLHRRLKSVLPDGNVPEERPAPSPPPEPPQIP